MADEKDSGAKAGLPTRTASSTHRDAPAPTAQEPQPTLSSPAIVAVLAVVVIALIVALGLIVFGGSKSPTEGASPSTVATPGTASPTPTVAPLDTSSPTPTTGRGVSGDGTATGQVNGCNTYGENCDENPIFVNLPPDNYDARSWPVVERVDHGTVLTARCWALGGITWNYAALTQPPDRGPDPYDSEVHYNVQATDGSWGWIPDTYFVRDKVDHLGLSVCPDQGPGT